MLPQSTLSSQLHDIHGLDPIPWFPPAPGWWAVAGACMLTLLAIALWVRHRRRYPPGGWKKDARALLRDLRRSQRGQSPKQTAGELSEVLRRIGMARFGREAGASLSSAEWLDWLTRHDPSGFDWRAQGEVLLRLPYAPAGTDEDALALSQLIDAALRMVARSREDATRKRRRLLILSPKEDAGV